MRYGHLVAFIGLAAAPCFANTSPLEQPTVKTTFKVERELEGTCSEIRAGKPNGPATLKMADVCHGWTTASCQEMVVVWAVGVTEDQDEVLFTGKDQAVNLVTLVDQAIGRRWQGHEHFHLQFLAPNCDGGTIVQLFVGSHLKANSTGATAGLKGEIRMHGPSDYHVSVEPGP